MSEQEKPAVGTIVWHDLTVTDAVSVRDFYCDVVGWRFRPHAMGEYDDFNILAPGGDEPITGICHARGTNANIPSQWLIYVTVADVDESAQRCVALGGQVLDGPRKMGNSRFCVIQDPAGAMLALIS